MSSLAMLTAATLALPTAHPHSICEQDDRVPTRAPVVGVVSDPLRSDGGFCTLTLVSDACALTAGHCLHVLGEARFFADRNFAGPVSADEFVYALDRNWTRALQSGIGNDWAVVRLKPNTKTGLLPGKVHGFIEPTLQRGRAPTGPLVINSAQRESRQEFALWTAEGRVLWISGRILYHNLDTAPGSSGSLIVDPQSGEGVAIHTHGGCDTMKNNKATLIAEVPNLVRSIQECRR